MADTSQMSQARGSAPRGRRRRLTRAQKAILAVGGVLAFALIAYGVLILVELFGQRTDQRVVTLTPTAGRLRLDVNGDIRIQPGADAQVHVTERLKYGLRRPRLSEQVTAAGLTVTSRCMVLDSYCSVDAVLTVPAGLSVDAHSSGGGITVGGLTGSVTLDSSGGGISVSALTGPVVLRSSGGDITADGVAGSLRMDSSGGGVHGTGLRGGQVDAHSSGGDVRLVFDAAPQRVSANSSGGGVRIELPRAEGGYHVTADSSGGGTSIDVPTDPQSSRSVDAHSSGGDVRIVTRQG
jgi:Putative adhesin